MTSADAAARDLTRFLLAECPGRRRVREVVRLSPLALARLAAELGIETEEDRRAREVREGTGPGAERKT